MYEVAVGGEQGVTGMETIDGIRLVSDLAAGADAGAPRGRDIFTIRDLAKEFGVSARTLRFYEEKGLLDPARRGDLAATLRQLASQERTVVVSTHDSEFARSFADRIVVLDAGRVLGIHGIRSLSGPPGVR